MDFIVKLLKSKNVITEISYNNIIIIIDKLIKYIYFILYKENFIIKQTIFIFLARIIRYHGTPISIISDRDKIFTNKFYQTLFGEIKIKQNLLTAYYSQTDGQIERIN